MKNYNHTDICSIPKIIHQIWSGVDGELPHTFKMMGDTWKNNHPDWEYQFWDNDRMNQFIDKYYPQYRNTYDNFELNIQRWDSIRYLILYHLGGMYVDFDYESIKSLNLLLKDKNCCFALEPEFHNKSFGDISYFNNALMASIPKHAFIASIIEDVFAEEHQDDYKNDNIRVLFTTGPHMLRRVYEKYKNKQELYLIPSKYVSPLSKNEAWNFFNKKNNIELRNKTVEAYAIHYFAGTWIKFKI